VTGAAIISVDVEWRLIGALITAIPHLRQRPQRSEAEKVLLDRIAIQLSSPSFALGILIHCCIVHIDSNNNMSAEAPAKSKAKSAKKARQSAADTGVCVCVCVCVYVLQFAASADS